MTLGWSRRRFLGSAGVALGVGGCGDDETRVDPWLGSMGELEPTPSDPSVSDTAQGATPSLPAEPPTSLLAEYFGAAAFEAVAQVGRAYADVFADADAFECDLAALQLGAVDSEVNDSATLRERVATEFDSGAIVFVSGWRLSQTEARLAGMVWHYRL